jgi:hypothetical protein
MKVFTEWTVLPHQPIEKLANNLWKVSAKMGNGQRQMTMARMRDGRVMIVNGIALEEPAMQELEAWGEPSVLVVPNAFHRQDARIWKQRYPKMTVVGPPKGKKRIEQVVHVDVLTTEGPPGDDTVRIVPMDGCTADTLVEVTSDDGKTLVFCDVILNVKARNVMMEMMLGPTGRVSVPRAMRWFGISDKKAFAAHVERMASIPELRRVLFGHGASVKQGAPEELRRVVAQLRG